MKIFQSKLEAVHRADGATVYVWRKQYPRARTILRWAFWSAVAVSALWTSYRWGAALAPQQCYTQQITK